MVSNCENNASNINMPQGNERQMGEAGLTLLHGLSSRHRDAVLESDTCGCFYCNSVFPATEVDEWTIEPGLGAVTALCPRCEIDAVLPASSVEEAGFELNPDVLAQMSSYWFDQIYEG